MMHCTLLVPDLLPPALRDTPAPRLRVPQLAALLARGNKAMLPPNEFDSWLCEAFGVARQNDWPVAPLTLAEDGGEPGDGFWLRCDPAYLYLQQHRMILSDAAGKPTAAESAALVETLNAHFREDGLQFFAGRDGRWYLRGDAHAKVTTQPLSHAMHRDIDSLMPTGDDSRHWRRVMNEIQMLLHAHPLNAEREARGLPAFNSVWLWGGGTVPAAGATAFTQAWSNEPLARALARRAGATVGDCPASVEPVMAAGGNALVVVTALRDATDLAQWQAALERVEQQWFAPCRQALQDGRLHSLTIVAPAAPHSRQFTITAAHRWRWWRRIKPIAAHV
jgi:hypothetical protein